MKKILLLAIVIMASSCAPSQEEIRAQRVQQMKDLISKTLSERIAKVGYKPIEFSDPDTVYSHFDDALLKRYKANVETSKRGLERNKGDKHMRWLYNEYKSDFDKYSDSLKAQESLQAAFVPEFVGYALTHTYGCELEALSRVKYTNTFIIDSTLSTIIKEDEGSIDWGDMTIGEILNLVNEIPFQSLIE